MRAIPTSILYTILCTWPLVFLTSSLVYEYFTFLLFLLGGLRTILTDTDKLVVAVGGVTALALGIYTTRFDLSVTVEILFIVS